MEEEIFVWGIFNCLPIAKVTHVKQCPSSEQALCVAQPLPEGDKCFQRAFVPGLLGCAHKNTDVHNSEGVI